MTKEARDKEIISQLIQDLRSGDSKTIVKALRNIKDKGDVTIIPVLLEIYPTSNIKLQEDIKSLLSELKISNALDCLINELPSADNQIAELILNSIWNSNLDASDYVSEIVEAAVKHEYMTAFEALTVVDNMEGPFMEESLSDAKIALNEYFQGSSDDKEEIMKTILGIVQQMDNSIMG